ncbi:hypothetical protein [Kitasatospora purpeofusca]|uniref:hypothetical protein n=1 Tax=Kitasatospora purpeofusca TaxID=67352 RepID=UPI0036D358E9
MTESEWDFDLLVVGGAGVDAVVRVDRLEVPAGLHHRGRAGRGPVSGPSTG